MSEGIFSRFFCCERSSGLNGRATALQDVPTSYTSHDSSGTISLSNSSELSHVALNPLDESVSREQSTFRAASGAVLKLYWDNGTRIDLSALNLVSSAEIAVWDKRVRARLFPLSLDFRSPSSASLGSNAETQGRVRTGQYSAAKVT